MRRARDAAKGLRNGAGWAGAATVFTPIQRWLLLAAVALLIMLRLPRAWEHGRFIDEEATVFLAYAWHRPWLDALFRPFAGYLNLGATAPTVLAVALMNGGILSLERAPYLTMTIALTVQLIPPALLLTGRAQWLASRPAVMGALLVVAIAPATEEVFFNVLHIQFHLALCGALILALDVPARVWTRAVYTAVLFSAPLCGPAVIVILPLFGLRALLDRDWGRLAQGAVLAAGAAVQLLGFYGANPMRGHFQDPATVAAMIFVRLIALPALGLGKADRIGSLVVASRHHGGIGWWWAVAATVSLFGLLVTLAARTRDSAFWLVISALLIAVLSFGFGMVATTQADLFSVGAERYQFLPLVLLGLALIALARRPQRKGRPLYAALVALLLFTGTYRYPRPRDAFRYGPSWPAEVAAWRKDHRHPLAVWPSPWAADLSDEAPPCSPVGWDYTRSADPRYCESGWVASFFRKPGER